MSDVARSNDVVARMVEKLRFMVRHELGRARLVSRRQAEVTEVINGSPKTLSIKIGGSDNVVTGVRYLASYTPSVGHTVWVDIQQEDMIVIGKLA